jgi:hypothetical protein
VIAVQTDCFSGRHCLGDVEPSTFCRWLYIAEGGVAEKLVTVVEFAVEVFEVDVCVVTAHAEFGYAVPIITLSGSDVGLEQYLSLFQQI